MNEFQALMAQGKDFSSEEGKKLIDKSERTAIKDAAQDPEIAQALILAMNNSSDPFFRRKVLLALSD